MCSPCKCLGQPSSKSPWKKQRRSSKQHSGIQACSGCPQREVLAQGNRECSSLTRSLSRPPHSEYQQPPLAAIYLDPPGTHSYDCPPYLRQQVLQQNYTLHVKSHFSKQVVSCCCPSFSNCKQCHHTFPSERS